MEVLSKSAQIILDEELASYRKKLLDRASLYMNYDDDILIRDKQIKAAIRDYETPELGRIQYANKKKRTRYLFFYIWTMFAFISIWLLFCVVYLERGSYEKSVVIVGIIASGVSILSLLWAIVLNRRRKGNKSDTIIIFLREWQEFESLLRYTYKGPNKSSNIAFTDLIDYYLDNFSNERDVDNQKIVNLLRVRNSLVHRGISDVNEDILLRQTVELQELINKVKKG